MHPPITVVHIPHASRLVPAECRSAILLDDLSLAEELRLMTDAYTDELFALDGSAPIRFPISRLVVDPERFTDDAHEPMAARGLIRPRPLSRARCAQLPVAPAPLRARSAPRSPRHLPRQR